MTRKDFLICGIDPGLKGAICFVNRDLELKSHLIPTINDFVHTESIVKIFESERNSIFKVYLEKGQAMPGQGVCSMFKYGKICGTLEAILVTLKIPYVLVRPQEWQTVHVAQNYALSPKERSFLTFREIFSESQALATKRSTKPHTGIVDAALIALYGAIDSQLIVPIGPKVQ